MTQADFSAIFSHSAIKRAKLAGLQRNARQLLTNNSHLS
jgi:epoxyqueuosine reductase QueG